MERPLLIKSAVGGAVRVFEQLIDDPAVPMALVIAGSAVASNILNFLTLGERLETLPQSV